MQENGGQGKLSNYAYRYVRNAMTPCPFGRNRAPHALAVAPAIGYALVRIDNLRNRPGRFACGNVIDSIILRHQNGSA